MLNEHFFGLVVIGGDIQGTPFGSDLLSIYPLTDLLILLACNLSDSVRQPRSWHSDDALLRSVIV